jgi:hypothetical protein
MRSSEGPPAFAALRLRRARSRRHVNDGGSNTLMISASMASRDVKRDSS